MNDLENVGSHIFTDALIRSAIYIEGKSKRGDFEAIVEMSYKKLGFEYFGNSVLPEDRENILGHQQSDKEIEATSTNPFINRNIVCRSCEKSFSPIEMYFINKIYTKLLDSDNFSNDGLYQTNKEEYLISYVFILINIWRTSAAKYNDWSLDSGYEELIRSYLLLVLSQASITDMINVANDTMSSISCFQFAIFSLNQTEGAPSENAILVDYTTEPYVFLLNRLLIIFSSNCFETVGPPASIANISTRAEIIDLSSSHSKLKVKLISNENRRNLLRKFYLDRWSDLVNHTKNVLSYAYNCFTGQILPNSYHLELEHRIGVFIKADGKGTPEALINLSAIFLKEILDEQFKEE
ncbi:MAG TPA: hypothetical protein PLZ32_08095 [Saprospiraceae bacterium]|nr:hypothetical protein [Saprospiraceae bacterium]